MNSEDVLQLVKQGFTADEIRALGFSAEPEKKPDEPEKKTDEPEKKKDEPANESEIEATIKGLSDTVAQLTETVKAMQVSNQKTAKKSRNDNAPKSADEVIKGFIENM